MMPGEHAETFFERFEVTAGIAEYDLDEKHIMTKIEKAVKTAIIDSIYTTRNLRHIKHGRQVSLTSTMYGTTRRSRRRLGPLETSGSSHKRSSHRWLNNWQLSPIRKMEGPLTMHFFPDT